MSQNDDSVKVIQVKVIDSSGIINARDAVIEGPFIALPEIKAELKDIQSRLKFEAAVSEGKIRLESPEKAAEKAIRTIAEKNGVLPLLSGIDIKVLALAYEKKLPIVTDDYDIQNICMLAGMAFETISMKGIKAPFKWKKKCTACGKVYLTDVVECETCGSESLRVLKRL